MKVILFDIDRTLIYTKNLRKAMNLAFKKVFGIDDAFEGISISGKTDLLILKEVFKKYGIKKNVVQIRKYKSCLCAMYKELLKYDHPKKSILPGVEKLLKFLYVNKDVKLGLLTGNFKESAYIKLDYFGLSKYFKFGAFGDDAIIRTIY